MAFIVLLYSGSAFLLGLLARSLLDTRPREGTTMAVLRELVAEHLGLARDRLGAAEARIALLEERVAFYDGFTRAERAGRPTTLGTAPPVAPGRPPEGWSATVLRFPSPIAGTEETPNSNL